MGIFWRFSQFNMDEQLVVTFLQHMINELTKEIEGVDIKKSIFGKLTPIIKDLTVGMTKQFVGDGVGDAMANVLTERKNDLVDEISQLKSNLQWSCVKI